MFGLDLGWLIAVVLGGGMVGKWLYKKDDQIEDRRRLTLQVSRGLSQQGLEVIPEVLEAYAIGDYSEVAKKLHEGATIMTNPALAKVVFDNLFEKMLAARSGDPSVRADIIERLSGGVIAARIADKPSVTLK